MTDSIESRLRSAALAGDMPLGQAFDAVAVADEIKWLRAELDAERALADRLARALLDGPFHGDRHKRRDRMYGSGWADVHDALDTWQEARRG